MDVGAFRLVARLGQGGMGDVWRGVHPASGAPVAVKLLRMLPHASLAAFRQEVRAVAGLDHPHVVWVLDHGELDEPAAAALGAAPGVPWLAMELLPGGTLAGMGGTLGWPAVRRALLQLLDALAHAHARGVVHRDLKPANVLPDGRGGVKLTDFGLALLAELDGEDHASSGTPAYMAPEQCRGDWRTFGPWTDLYALGCLGWTLVTGRPPFVRGSTSAVMVAHLAAAPPRLAPVRPVPPGLEEWLRTLLEKDPARRFRRAADAAAALALLGDVEDRVAPLPVAPDPQAPTLSVLVTRVAVPVRPAASDARPAPAPACPAEWRRGDAPPRPQALHGAGLGLYGLRALPLVGREEARDGLWEALRRVHAAHAPAAVVLRGASGSGKSRLARWLCERAHEVGAATVLAAVHDPGGGRAAGLSAAVERALRLRGVERSGLADHVAAFVPGAGPELAAALGELGDAPPRERRRAVARLLEALAAERPVVLWLDDAQWGAEALRLATSLLDGHLPVLVVLTVREEALPENPVEDGLLRTFVAKAGVAEIAVGPLARHEAGALVRELLPFDERLAERIEARVGGNPLFAVQLVGDWVARGLLRVGPSGFALRPGPEPRLPDDLHAVWAARVERLLAARPPGDRVALTLAALLGQEVDGDEWRAVCAGAGATADPGWVGVLELERLATAGPEGWAFVHGMLRESIARDAPAELHRVCARVLLERAGAGATGRAAEHLLAAGDRAAGAEALLTHAIELYNEHAPREALAVVDRLDALALELGYPPTHRLRIETLIRRASVYRQVGEGEEALRTVVEAERLAEQVGNRHLLAIALHHHGGVHHDQAGYDRAIPLLRRAVAASAGSRVGPPVMLTLAGSLAKVGAFDEAERIVREAVAVVASWGDRPLERHVEIHGYELLTDLALRRGAWTEADRWAEKVIEASREERFVSRLSNAMNSRGEAARHAGDLEAARRWYEQAADLDRRVGGTLDGRVILVNLAVVDLLLGAAEAARGRAAGLLADPAVASHAAIRTIAALVVACVESDPVARAAAVDTALAAVAAGGFVEHDVALLALRAAVGAGDPERRAALQALADDQLRRLAAR